MSNTITFKVTFRENTHRFSVPESDLTIDKFNETMSLVFQKKNIAKFQKKYQDPDGDMITLQSELDLIEAVKVAKEFNNSVVRINLTRPSFSLDQNKRLLSRRFNQVEEINSDEEETTDVSNTCNNSQELRHSALHQMHRCRSKFGRRRFGGHVKSTFLADVTLTDASEVNTNEQLVKTWRLLNSGDVAWPIGSCLTYISGDKLSADESVIIEKELLPEETIEISFNFKAPSKPGRYISHFRMAKPNGQLFGQRIYIDVIVVEAKQKEEYIVKDIPIEEPNPVEIPDYNGVYADQIKILHGMGFVNTKHSLEILESTSGDLAQAIERLLLWQ